MRRIIYILILVVLVLVIAGLQNTGIFRAEESRIDLSEVESKGSLVVAMNKNSADYFLYKGEPMGFQLEMLEDLGTNLGIKIEVIVCNDNYEMLDNLRCGKCDMVAGSWNYSDKAQAYASSSIPILETDMLLVQRKLTDGKKLVRNLEELRNHSVYVPLMSSQADLLGEYRSQMQVVEMPQYPQEKLVELVAKGNIDYTICNGIQAENLRVAFPLLDFNTVVHKAQPVTWVFRNTSIKLNEKVNNWLCDYKKSTRFSILLDKYYNSSNKWASARNRYYALSDKRISEYDELIKKYSKEIHWDWRLLASLICQESRFNADIKSNRGAFGLMQLMPSTLMRFGIDTTASPESQIKAGVKFIKFLDKSLSLRVRDPQERINFILASYNIGPGHIFDAQRLATKLGKNPQKWFNNVDTCLLSKSDPDNYNDPQVEFGYCKGHETFAFVQEVMDRYLHYKNVIPK